jgi:hypothetical protein
MARRPSVLLSLLLPVPLCCRWTYYMYYYEFKITVKVSKLPEHEGSYYTFQLHALRSQQR